MMMRAQQLMREAWCLAVGDSTHQPHARVLHHSSPDITAVAASCCTRVRDGLAAHLMVLLLLLLRMLLHTVGLAAASAIVALACGGARGCAGMQRGQGGGC